VVFALSALVGFLTLVETPVRWYATQPFGAGAILACSSTLYALGQ
jgi:hypothetical protein